MSSVKEGLRTRERAWKPRARPATKRVLPAPNGPSRTITSPAESVAASDSPSASVSLSDAETLTSASGADAPRFAFTAGAASA